MHRAMVFHHVGTISKLSLVTEVTVAIAYAVGAALFVIGSVLFLPSLYSIWAAPIFLIGSVMFLLATLSATFADLIRIIHRWNKSSGSGGGDWKAVPSSDDAHTTRLASHEDTSSNTI